MSTFLQQEQFRKKLEKTVKETRQECARIAAEESARIAKLNKEHTDNLNKEYVLLISLMLSQNPVASIYGILNVVAPI